MSLNERTSRAYELLGIMKTAPAFIFDLVDFKLFGEYRLHPLLVEQLLSRRGQFDGSVSIRDNIARFYGCRAAQLAEELI